MTLVIKVKCRCRWSVEDDGWYFEPSRQCVSCHGKGYMVQTVRDVESFETEQEE